MMTTLKRLMAAGGLAWLAAVPLLAVQEPQTGFLPMNSLPPAEQIPAAPLLIAAYTVVWLALMAYVWSIWSRLGKVEREVQMLQRNRGQGPR
jgi:CcmD family protein